MCRPLPLCPPLPHSVSDSPPPPLDLPSWHRDVVLSLSPSQVSPSRPLLLPPPHQKRRISLHVVPRFASLKCVCVHVYACLYSCICAKDRQGKREDLKVALQSRWASICADHSLPLPPSLSLFFLSRSRPLFVTHMQTRSLHPDNHSHKGFCYRAPWHCLPKMRKWVKETRKKGKAKGREGSGAETQWYMHWKVRGKGGYKTKRDVIVLWDRKTVCVCRGLNKKASWGKQK